MRVSSPVLRFVCSLALGVATGCQSGHESCPAPDNLEDARAVLSKDDSLEAVRLHFYRAVEGDSQALRQCQVALEALPGQDAKARAYRGACDMLASAQARLPWEKGRYAKSGLRLLDGAVEEAPSDLEVRFVRGMTCYNLPSLFNRSAMAADDLARVAARAEAASADGTLEPALAAAALYHYGVIQSRIGSRDAAEDLWRRADALAPTTHAARRAAENLAAP